MAENENPDVDEETQEDAPAGGGLLKKLLIPGGAILLLAVGIFAGPMIQNMMSGSDEAAEEDVAEVEPKKNEPADGPELYQGLHPALVVNFRDAAGDSHFMQVEMEVMARDQDIINAVKDHTPVIRNNLILLYGGVQYENITTREGKEQMLKDGLREIQKVMDARVGSPNVEALYFTSLIIQ